MKYHGFLDPRSSYWKLELWSPRDQGSIDSHLDGDGDEDRGDDDNGLDSRYSVLVQFKAHYAVSHHLSSSD